MKTKTQYNIAVFSILLFSKTLFASDIKINPSAVPTSVLSGTFSGVSIGVTPKPNTPKINDIVPIVPKPAQPKLPVFKQDKKLPGTFGTPIAELLKGNLVNARASCIQEAIQSGDRIPTNDSSVWDFVSNYRGSDIKRLPNFILPAGSVLPNSGKGVAFAKGGTCSADIKQSACVALLEKATTEVTQAYYNSELNNDQGIWDDVLNILGLPLSNDSTGSQDIVSALKSLKNEDDLETDPTLEAAFKHVETQDPLIVATTLLIIKIDEALARGDREGSEKAKALLTKINPSAAHAVSCILSSLALGGLNENLDSGGRPKGAYYGPLSGTDYSKQAKFIQTSSPVAWAAIGTPLLMGLVTWWQNRGKNADEAKSRDVARNDQRLKDYMACTAGTVCDQLYPEQAKFVSEAKAADAAAKAKSGVAGAGNVNPFNPNPSEPVDMFAPSVPPKPGVGSGGSGGELAPTDLADPMSEIEKKARNQHGISDISIDLNSAQNYCDKVVADYKTYSGKKFSSGGNPAEGNELDSSPVMTTAFGVVQFEKWTNDYWTKIKANRLANDAAYRNEQNNCQAMDRAEGQ